jgi:hypothetical protein
VRFRRLFVFAARRRRSRIFHPIVQLALSILCWQSIGARTKTTLHHVVHHVGTYSQCSNDKQKETDHAFPFHCGYSGAPLAFGKLMVVFDEPLDIGE